MSVGVEKIGGSSKGWGWIAFGVGFSIPVMWAVAYWSYFERHPSTFADAIGQLGEIACPPVLLRIDPIALPFLNGIFYFLVFYLIRLLRSLAQKADTSGSR
jgi:hypothetical protein